MRLIWIAVGLLSLGAGIIGLFVPLLPSTPLLLLASYAFARSSDRLHQWLLSHRHFGTPIRDWQREHAIHRRSKRAASFSIAATFAISVIIGVPMHLLLVQLVVLAIVVAYIWSRPEPSR